MFFEVKHWPQHTCQKVFGSDQSTNKWRNTMTCPKEVLQRCNAISPSSHQINHRQVGQAFGFLADLSL